MIRESTHSWRSSFRFGLVGDRLKQFDAGGEAFTVAPEVAISLLHLVLGIFVLKDAS